MSTTFSDLTDEEVAEYEAAANEAMREIEQERQECDHESRTFHTEDREQGIPAVSTCNNCTHMIAGNEAYEVHQ